MQNYYLVLYRCTMDDLPVAISTDWNEALAIAMGLSDTPPEEPQNILGLDATTPHSVAIVTFIGGQPAGIDTVQDFT